MRKGFTLIEILVVATIIGLLASAGMASYITLNKNGRDARRKADLENLRAALEQYKSNNNYYPNALSTLTSGVVYIGSVPSDPKYGSYPTSFTPASCTTNCTDYTIGAYLEGSTSTCGVALTCGSAGSCNYCVGPYGQK